MLIKKSDIKKRAEHGKFVFLLSSLIKWGLQQICEENGWTNNFLNYKLHVARIFRNGKTKEKLSPLYNEGKTQVYWLIDSATRFLRSCWQLSRILKNFYGIFR